MDQKLYADLAAATKYYMIGNEFEERIQKENHNIQALAVYANERKNAKTAFKSMISSVGTTVAIISGVFLLLCAIVAMTGVQADSTDMILIPLIAVGFVVSIIAAIAFKAAKNKAFKEWEEEYEAQIKPQIEEAQYNLASLKENLTIFEKDSHHVVEFLPTTYRNPQATAYMLLTVSNGRADSLKEAINLYEEQLHRWKLEEYARQGAEAQEYCALAMDELNSRQAQTNAHLQAIEFMQFVNFITK